MNEAIEQEAATVRRPAEPPSLDLEMAKLTDVGRARPHNEDYVDYYLPPDPQLLAAKGAIYLVADGMGGHQAGEVASRGAVELVISQYYADTTHDVGASLVRAFRAANQQIQAQAKSDPDKAGMGTTLVAVVILGRKVYVANVGDSRAYLINGQGITQITEDHSWVEEQVRAKLLTPEQARRHPQRNLVTRALGSKPDVQVDLFEGELNAGDMLLLCSDGLTGRVEDQEIAACLKQYPAREAAQQLIDLANERGGNDNITVLIVSAQPEVATVVAPPPPPPQKKKERRTPLAPVLAGLAVILVLALGGLVGARFVLPLFTKTATPLPTVAASATIPLDTATPPVVQLSPTLEITATRTLTPEVTELVPTATLSPTTAATDIPPATNTSAAPSVTPTPSDTPGPSHPAPTPVEPLADAQLHGVVTFKWDYPPGQLGEGNAFQVLIWKKGTAQHLGADKATTAHEQTIDLDALLEGRGGRGEYFWTVVVVRQNSGEQLSHEATPQPFIYQGPAPPLKPKPTDKPSEKPTPSGGVEP